MSLEAAEKLVSGLASASGRDPGRSAELLRHLSEDHPLYSGRSGASVIRLRGFLLQAFEFRGLPEAAVPLALEELESGHSPYAVAAAAKALRGWEKPSSHVIPYLMRAFARSLSSDEFSSFLSYDAEGTSEDGTTACAEILKTLAWLGPLAQSALPELRQAAAEGVIGPGREPLLTVAIESIRSAPPLSTPCCGLPDAIGGFRRFAPGERPAAPLGLEFEDQDANKATFGELFLGRPSVVAFFYTRCENPGKCSLTVTKLARIQKLLAAEGLAGQTNLAAITYDPLFDSPSRLNAYGLDRGMRMDDRNRMLRSLADMEDLHKWFRLGVNYVGSVVNHHRIEVYLLDSQARVAASFQRIDWDETKLVAQLMKLKTDPPRKHRLIRSILSFLPALALGLLPKCPFCLAAYFSALGIAGVTLPEAAWLRPLLAVFILINVGAAAYRAARTGWKIPFLFASIGALAIAPYGLGYDVPRAILLAGIALTGLGAAAGAFRNVPAGIFRRASINASA